MQAGTPKFDGIAVHEGTFAFHVVGGSLKVKAAFVDSKSGHTHGWTTGEGPIWSKETMEAMNTLRASMERDLARLHFTGSALEVAGDTVSTASPTGASVGGLGEHLGTGEEDAQQV
jgi:hypothetical protein